MKKSVDHEEAESEEENDSSQGVEESSSDEEASGDGAQQEGSDSESGEDDDSVDDEADDSNEQQKQSRRIAGSSSSEQCTFDLRNLVAVNSHQLDASSLYSSKSKSKESDITIPQTDHRLHVDEAQLLEKAQDGCAQLISALWQLPTESSDAGPLVTLPSYFEIKIPRALVSLRSIQYYLLPSKD
jgi:hypothetical protein